jgi:hypothetical protein
VNTAEKFNHILTALLDADIPDAREAVKMLREIEQMFLRNGGLLVAAKDRLKMSTAWLEVFKGVARGETPRPKPEGVELIVRHNKTLLDKIEKELHPDGPS